ncbi:MAG: hypothetical protein LUC92_09725 [Clostridiales bacterium]|nr:hypothetical protein [Clostridiales bacterium]
MMKTTAKKGLIKNGNIAIDVFDYYGMKRKNRIGRNAKIFIFKFFPPKRFRL